MNIYIYIYIYIYNMYGCNLCCRPLQVLFWYVYVCAGFVLICICMGSGNLVWFPGPKLKGPAGPAAEQYMEKTTQANWIKRLTLQPFPTVAHAEPGGDKPNLRLHEIWFASWMRRIILGTHPGCDFMCVMCSVSCLRFETYAFQVLCYKSHPGPWYANTRHKHVTHIPFGCLSGFAALGTPWDLLKAFRVLTFMGNEYRQYLCNHRSTAHRSTTPGGMYVCMRTVPAASTHKVSTR